MGVSEGAFFRPRWRPLDLINLSTKINRDLERRFHHILFEGGSKCVNDSKGWNCRDTVHLGLGYLITSSSPTGKESGCRLLFRQILPLTWGCDTPGRRESRVVSTLPMSCRVEGSHQRPAETVKKWQEDVNDTPSDWSLLTGTMRSTPVWFYRRSHDHSWNTPDLHYGAFDSWAPCNHGCLDETQSVPVGKWVMKPFPILLLQYLRWTKSHTVMTQGGLGGISEGR